ncbi:CheR family methyltransferase [Methanosalsum natronophilum]|uniref:protein-glutamate O-methyltransferase n=1 Tax=Methanosalsum natronophilum TaxID=768733 RepID=A0A3R7XI19_9EURY|nr:protein-glutamate O-methyltransferase CheR [Methanosalsum natronophilum]MCS3922977.1 chemotaxis protein methyltransferase CheR [Methanosalsum natronophilum]RQD85340.1 MAG: protein-glutamate O-methyltransferase CheR [Methanosalsum natronophilum]
MDRNTEIKTLNEDSDFIELKKTINKKIGFNCDQYKPSHFKRRIDIRLRANNCTEYSQYVKVLKNEPKELEKLIDTLTVNVTEFFRNKETYELIEQKVLPEILKKKNVSSVNVWSAGSSIGVEAYSVAILLNKALGSKINRYNIKILGTDIDNKSLNRATEGIYTSMEVRNIDSNTLETYFTFQDNKYHVKDKLKNLVKFKHHDLISGGNVGNFDLILCRNVTIYFERELQEKLYHKFHSSLVKEGFLVIGKTETLVGDVKDLFVPFNLKERVYRK